MYESDKVFNAYVVSVQYPPMGKSAVKPEGAVRIHSKHFFSYFWWRFKITFVYIP